MLRATFLLFLSGLAACASVDWQPPPAELPTRWRDHRLFVSEQAYVLARDESAAAESHELIAAVRDQLASHATTKPLGRPLILALSFEDPLPIAEPEAWTAAMQEWWARLNGARGDFRIGNHMQVGPDGKQLEVDPAIPLHMLSTPVVGDDPRLGLPPQLVAAADCVVLLPTETAIRAAADVLIDAALEAQGISSFTYAAMRLVVGDPADKMWEKMSELATETLTKTWANAHDIELVDAGVTDPESLPPGQLPDGWYLLVKPGARTAAAPPWFVVGQLRGTTVIENGPWNGFVDTFEYTDERIPANMLLAGRHYLHVPDKGQLPTRADAERVDQLVRAVGDRGMIFVSGNQEFGAALVASHSYWVLRKSQLEALRIAEYYGVGAKAAELVANWKNSR